MITIKEGNILEGNQDIIIQQVNCLSVMGAGLAKQIRDKYPHVFTLYKIHCDVHKSNREKLLGQVLFVNTSDGKVIANAFGQLGFGRDKVQTDYEALEAALWKVKAYAIKNKLTVSLPEGLGCGLAGGDWNIVYGLIKEVFHDYDVTIYKYN